MMSENEYAVPMNCRETFTLVFPGTLKVYDRLYSPIDWPVSTMVPLTEKMNDPVPNRNMCQSGYTSTEEELTGT